MYIYLYKRDEPQKKEEKKNYENIPQDCVKKGEQKYVTTKISTKCHFPKAHK